MCNYWATASEPRLSGPASSNASQSPSQPSLRAFSVSPSPSVPRPYSGRLRTSLGELRTPPALLSDGSALRISTPKPRLYLRKSSLTDTSKILINLKSKRLKNPRIQSKKRPSQAKADFSAGLSEKVSSSIKMSDVLKTKCFFIIIYYLSQLYITNVVLAGQP